MKGARGAPGDSRGWARDRLVRALRIATLLALCLPAPPAEGTGDALSLLSRLEVAWRSRDLATYLSLWDLSGAEARQEERAFAEGHFAAEETEIRIQRPPSLPAGVTRFRVSVDIFSITEPRGRVEQWLFTLEKDPFGWTLNEREPAGHIDGLVHLSMDPAGFRAEGLTLVFEDFRLEMKEGTLFTSPPLLGPTALVFVGTATVRFRPRPPTEQEQLRQFCGRRELVEPVSAAFVRIHPADLHRVLLPTRLTPDPDSHKRLKAAQAFYRDHASRAFVLDMGAPRAPWWLLPSLGDSSITFRTAKRGTLSFTVSGTEPEGLMLFDRAKRRHICLYAAQGASTRYDEDQGRAADVLHHDLRVRFDPGRGSIEGEDTLRIRMLEASGTIRIKLDDALRVESITSREGGSHLFFRVRNQDSVMVSLGALSTTVGEILLTVRYAGALSPDPIEREGEVLLTGSGSEAQPGGEEEVLIEKVLVYTNRDAWYPQLESDDYALATLRFDLPLDHTAVTGGVRTDARIEGDRKLVEYRQDLPGKYITAVVGRLVDAGAHRERSPALQAFAVSRLRKEAADTLVQASEILRFYAREFGPCPYGNLNLVMIEGVTPGGHSPPGMILVSRRPVLLRGSLRDDPANFPDAPGFFLAHELAHQWWGHGVAGENYHERWLSEAVAQYAAALWVRHSQGEGTFRDMLRQMARWALKENDQGPISLGYRLGHIKAQPQTFRAIVYDKGAYVLHMLRAIVGEEAFRTALTSFQSRHRFQKAGTQDLRESLEAASGKDLAAYFDAWVFGTAVPLIRLSHRDAPAGAGHNVVVELSADRLPGPVPLEVSFTLASGTELRRIMLAPSGGSFSFELPEKPRKVEVNADRGLLAMVEQG
jgi:hypothetical protein